MDFFNFTNLLFLTQTDMFSFSANQVHVKYFMFKTKHVDFLLLLFK